MSTVYVMIACDACFEKSVIGQFKTMNVVKNVKRIMGEYGILVKLESNNSNELKNIVL